MSPRVTSFFDPRTSTATYLVADPVGGRAAVIDPVLDFDRKSGRVWTESADAVLATAKAEGLSIDWVLETHAHADHLSGGRYLQNQTGAKIAAGAHIIDVQRQFKPMFGAHDLATDGSAFDRLLDDGDVLAVGGLEVRALHTPGHTPACVTYLVEDCAFVGDTLFMPDYGTARADFPGGDAASLYRSIRRILGLAPETKIYVGHDYPAAAGRDAPRLQTTVAEERASNKHVHDGVDEAGFIAMRTARDATLEAPELLLPSLQVNIRAGRLPPAEPDGRSYLKLPLAIEANGLS